MTFERSYMNWDEGVGVCCWSAQSKEELEKLFKESSVPYDSIVEVEEHVSETLVN